MMSHPHPERCTASEFPGSSNSDKISFTCQKRGLDVAVEDLQLVQTKRPKRNLDGPVLVREDGNSLNDEYYRGVAAGETHNDAVDFDADTSRLRVLAELRRNAPPELRHQIGKDIADFNLEARQFGQASVKPANGGLWTVKGMKTPLLSHQIVGAGRGLRMEKDSRGVLLMDHMGLGKTLMALAAIAATRQSPAVDRRATLVIVQPNNFEQWRREIKTHCTALTKSNKAGPGISDIVFWRSESTARDLLNPLHQLRSADIVLTTTFEIVKSFNRKQNGKSSPGLPHQVKYFRVCLDEAHEIRNEHSSLFKACRAIDAEHHWAITGTPCVNSSQDLYPIFNFLNHPLATDKKSFKAAATDAVDMVHRVLKDSIIYRTYESTQFGGKLANLPNTTRTVVEVSLTGLEAWIYELLHARFATYVKKVTESKSENKQFLLMNLQTRPRQLVSHPIMLQDTLCTMLEEQDVTKLVEMLDPDKYDDEKDKNLATILKKCMQTSLLKQSRPGNVAPDHQSVVIKEEPALYRAEKCVSCKTLATVPLLASCSHVYCEQCMSSLYKHYQGSGMAECCQKCDAVFEHYPEYINTADVPGGSEPGTGFEKLTQSFKDGRKSVGGSIADWKINGKIYRNAKVTEIANRTRSYLEEDDDGKIIWFTQFLAFGKVLVEVCKEEGWACVEYHGSMNAKAKDNAVEKFNNAESRVRVFIASLKAGGVGLNLTGAAKVFSCDHWWNTAMEQQAFARVYRIGQKKETEFFTVVIKKTIEERMVEIKARKDGDISNVISPLEMQDLFRPFADEP